MKTLKVGDKVYLPTELFFSHGVDDFEGGICTVSKIKVDISAGKETIFFSVKENPGTSYNWEHYRVDQSKLKKHFGNRKGHKRPDYRPEFNRFF